MKTYWLHIFYEGILTHSEPFKTFEEADREADEYRKCDMDGELSYDIEEVPEEDEEYKQWRQQEIDEVRRLTWLGR